MKRNAVILPAILLLGSLGIHLSSLEAKPKEVDLSKLYGKVQFVTSFPDYKIQVVNSFPDLKVQLVDSFPDKPGMWQKVDSFPDFKVQVVDSFPDFTVQFVTSFPGPK